MSVEAVDEAMLKQIRSGEDAAFRKLYKQFYGMVRYLVLNNSGSDEEAQDVFQDAVIILYEKVQQPGFELTASIKTYLYSVCRNLWLKRLRDKQKTNKVKWVDFEPKFEVPDEPEEDLSERQRHILVNALEKLGDPCKTLLESFYYHKKNMTEIASQLKYSNADTAKNQKYKCLQRLRKLATAA